ncbi:MAG: hypothetical protein NTW21_41045 [Verrucomicrobia bacterium]|nr:hypothetical protein [Verrucomicrobiota bacterium]
MIMLLIRCFIVSVLFVCLFGLTKKLLLFHRRQGDVLERKNWARFVEAGPVIPICCLGTLFCLFQHFSFFLMKAGPPLRTGDPAGIPERTHQLRNGGRVISYQLSVISY